MRDPRARLLDILDAIEDIERYAPGQPYETAREELLEVWFIRHLQVIGEAARSVPQQVRDRAPAVPWAGIVGMRNILVHEYFGVNLSIIRDIVERDLPALKREVQALLQILDEEARG